VKRCLALLIAACGSSSPPPAAPKPSNDDKVAAQAQADADRAAAEMARANETARAQGVILTTATTNPPACCTTLVKKASLGKLGEVQIWKGAAEQLTKYVVVFGSGSTWRLAEPIDYIEGGDCGAGHCVDRKLGDVAIDTNASGFRVAFHITEDHYRNEGGAKHENTSTHDVVVACTIDATPTCDDGRSDAD
jgi:hypothetical protein